MNDDPLWQSLERFEFERLGGFADRLAVENGWERSFALRVIAEYRRFLFLAVRAGHQVTPSTVIDEAWHLHLLYTESYWNDLCARVLCRPLHHGPTSGTVDEEKKFRNWYQRTLSSYRCVFGEEPPADIWPRGVGRKKRYRLVDSERYFVVPRPNGGQLSRGAAVAGAGVVFAGAAGRNAVVELGDLVFILVIGLIVGLILLLTSPARKRRGEGDSSGSCSGGCGGGTGVSSSDGSSSDGDCNDGGSDGGCDGGGDGGSCGSSCGGGCGGGGD